MALFSVYMMCAGASADESPQEIVEENYEVVFPTPTSFTVNTTYGIYRIGGMNASDLRAIYRIADVENRSVMKEMLEANSKDLLDGMLNDTFLNVTGAHSSVELDMTSLAFNDTNSSVQVPIILNGTGHANFTLDTYGLPTEAELANVIYGALKMGAIIHIDTSVTAGYGHNVSYRFETPEEIVFHPGTPGYLPASPGTVFFNLSNCPDPVANSTSGPPAAERLMLNISHETPNPVHSENITASIIIDRVEFNRTLLGAKVSIYSVDIADYANFSDHITGMDHVSADGIRLAMESLLDNWQLQAIEAQVIENITGQLRERLSEALETEIELGFLWDNSSTMGYDRDVMGSSRPVVAWLNSSAPVEPELFKTGEGIFDLEDLRIAMGFLNAGGRANFTVPAMSFDAGIVPEMLLILSPGMRLETGNGTESFREGRYGYEWDPRHEFNGSIYSVTAPSYDSEKAYINVTIDMYEVDVKWFRIKTSRALLDARAYIEYYRIRTPEEIMEKLGDSGIYIEYINADIIRLLFDTDLMGRSNVEDMISNITAEFEAQLSGALNKRTRVYISIGEDAFSGVDVDHMDDLPAIKLWANATSRTRAGTGARMSRTQAGTEAGISRTRAGTEVRISRTRAGTGARMSRTQAGTEAGISRTRAGTEVRISSIGTTTEKGAKALRSWAPLRRNCLFLNPWWLSLETTT